MADRQAACSKANQTVKAPSRREFLKHTGQAIASWPRVSRWPWGRDQENPHCRRRTHGVTLARASQLRQLRRRRPARIAGRG